MFAEYNGWSVQKGIINLHSNNLQRHRHIALIY